MSTPRNLFKERLLAGEPQCGVWVSLADPVAAEISAGAGFDWLVIDGEHAPNDLRSVLVQLQAIAAHPVSPIVRPVRGEASLIKQYLDLGVQTILAPMVESPEHATHLARAVRYPPDGIRGVASARAAQWGRVDDYWERANAEACLLVQIETRAGIENLDAIAAVDGVDGLFVGPSDLGASFGYLGQAGHPEVRRMTCEALSAIRRAGKAAGVLAMTAETAAEYVAAGATFVGLGVDTNLLARATTTLASTFRDLL